MIRFKRGVSLNGVQPELAAIFPIIAGAYQSIGKDAIITSLRDGRHSRGSLHYVGYAVDLRTKHLTTREVRTVFEQLRRALTTEFDVLCEPTPPHLHIEFQPKR